MILAWILNAVSLFAMTAGSLLFFLSLWQTPRSADDEKTPEQKLGYIRRRRTIAIGGTLLSLWFLMQYLALLIA